MYNFINLTKRNIKYFKQINKSRDRFNTLNKDFFEIYNKSNFMQQLLLRRKVKLLKFGSKYIGYIWSDNVKQSTFNIFSMYISKNANMISCCKAFINEYSNESVFNYTGIINDYNFKVLTAIGFKQIQGTLSMFLDLEKYTTIDVKQDSVHFPKAQLGQEEKNRCYIQNEVFKTKERKPLKVDDIVYDEMQEYYFNEGALFVKQDDQYIGYGQIIIENGNPYLVNIGILSEYRHKGYGTLLLQSLLNILKKTAYSKVYLKVDLKNEAAIKLYENLGFLAKAKIYKWQLKN